MRKSSLRSVNNKDAIQSLHQQSLMRVVVRHRQDMIKIIIFISEMAWLRLLVSKVAKDGLRPTSLESV